MSKLIKISILFITLINLFLWNIGPREVSTSDTEIIQNNISHKKAISIVGNSSQKNISFFEQNQGEVLEYRKKIDKVYYKSWIPFVYKRGYSIEGVTNIIQVSGDQSQQNKDYE